MNLKRGISDLWLLLVMVAVMWLVWYASGGPARFSVDEGPFLEPPSPLGSGKTYGQDIFSDFPQTLSVPGGNNSVSATSSCAYLISTNKTR